MAHDYHDGTKHHFDRFARSLGYLDWASQPDPFRSFHGSSQCPLFPRPGATYSSVGDILRHSLGLSAWKEFRGSRWSLRVNPSSGNLHPTEAYIVCGPTPGLSTAAGVYHYAPDRHALEQRCAFDPAAWNRSLGSDSTEWFVVLTSIHWREAWKYGERAFRYCQHDLGHAIAAVAIAAALAGQRAAMVPGWSHQEMSALAGLDRDEDYVDAEREDVGCMLRIVSRQQSAISIQESAFSGQQSPVGSESRSALSHESSTASRAALIDAVRKGTWTGRANQLSEDHVQWTFIDDIARATQDPGRPFASAPSFKSNHSPDHPMARLPDRALLLQRRSAVALDGRSSIDADHFFAILQSVMPANGAPWDALWWDPRIHFLLFVHRVDGLDPGLYLLVRNLRAIGALRAAIGRGFEWETVDEALPLFRLAQGDCRRLAQRVSCDQEIAGDGFFSLGMLAEFDASLQRFGSSFYRHLFWESGVVGQKLYLAAEAAGARGTGIGCFYDNPVHEVLGLAGHAFQSLYHFTIGVPVEDTRLTTEPGYAWE